MALRFRFTDEQDIAQYGDRWWVWDEGELTRLRGRELIALEETIGISLLKLRRELDQGSTLALMGAMWIVLHRAGNPVAWDDFNPATLTATWEVEPEAPLDSGGAPEPAPDSSTPPSSESATS